MRFNKILLSALFVAVLLTSCRKDHYDVGNVHGVNAEGELLLPIASKSFSMKDMMERFQIDSLINYAESGAFSYAYCYEHYDAVSGDNMLRFKDLNYHEHYAFDNPYVSQGSPITDTTLNIQRTILFESDNISVLEAVMKSGRLDFHVESNFGNLRHVVLRSSDIHDAFGNEFVLDVPVHYNTFGFDLADLHYMTDTANTLTFSYELYCSFYPAHQPKLYVDLSIVGHDLAMSTMRGFVETYGTRNLIDTVFTMLPDNLAGIIEVEDVSLRVSERNTFPLGARLVIDTALVMGDGIDPYSIFDPLPLAVDLPVQDAFSEVFSQTLSGKLNACGGRAYASSDFIVNPEAVSDLVTVADTSGIDVRIDVDIPFAFEVNNVSYVDTVNMRLSELDMPDLIERITLELTFTSTLPINLSGRFYMYNSDNEMITDTLLANAQLIRASFDGHPSTTLVSIDITEERIENVLRSDRIIMVYTLDTEGHDVQLNANQNLGLFVKAKVKYDGAIELKM